MASSACPTRGFTLIELSIVLVIIGLIVGGVLVGRDIIAAAAVRSQITQIEKYNSAVNTFRDKYSYLPGDIPDPYASQNGFKSRGGCAGTGDGNGVIEGVMGYCGPGTNQGNDLSSGETALFWEDLSVARLIDGQFNTANASSLPSANVTSTGLGLYFPPAQIGNGNYVYVYSGGTYPGVWVTTGVNYFGLSAPSSITISCCGRLSSVPGLTVSAAYNIDRKIDDGLPQSGKVTAVYLNQDPVWTDGTDTLYSAPNTAATSPSATSCYNNSNVAGQQHYSVEVNNGAGVNCALSFVMQGAGR